MVVVEPHVCIVSTGKHVARGSASSVCSTWKGIGVVVSMYD